MRAVRASPWRWPALACIPAVIIGLAIGRYGADHWDWSVELGTLGQWIGGLAVAFGIWFAISRVAGRGDREERRELDRMRRELVNVDYDVRPSTEQPGVLVSVVTNRSQEPLRSVLHWTLVEETDGDGNTLIDHAYALHSQLSPGGGISQDILTPPPPDGSKVVEKGFPNAYVEDLSGRCWVLDRHTPPRPVPTDVFQRMHADWAQYVHDNWFADDEGYG